MFARFSYHLKGFPNLTGKFELLNIGYKYKQIYFSLKCNLCAGLIVTPQDIVC